MVGSKIKPSMSASYFLIKDFQNKKIKALATGLNIILLQHPFDFVEWQC